MQSSSNNLKILLDSFRERLEMGRERIEGAVRLHHLLSLHLKEDDVQIEMRKLAEKIGVAGLIERCKENVNKNVKELHTSTPRPKDKNLLYSTTDVTTPTSPAGHCDCWRNVNDHMERRGRMSLPRSIDSGGGKSEERSVRVTATTCQDDDEEDHSKMADSGLGYCDRCDGHDKLIRSCSCQSFEDPTNASSKR